MADTTYLSLFAGVGGLDLALRLALPASRPVCYVENDIAVCRILAARMADGSLESVPLWSDVRTFPCGLYRGRVAGIIGGFPCTDLSLAGKRAGIHAGEASGLWWEYLRIIRDVQPAWVFIENVPGLLCSPGSDLEPEDAADGESADWVVRNIDAVLGPLADIGFDAEWLCLRASDVGASQERKRVFIMARRKLADTRDGLIQEPGRGPQAGDGARSGSAEVDDSAEPLLPWSQNSRTDQRDEGTHRIGSAQSERRCGILEHAALRGCGELRQPPASSGQPDRADAGLDESFGRRREGAEIHLRSARQNQTTAGAARRNSGLVHAPRQREPELGSGRRRICDPIGKGLEERKSDPGDHGGECETAERAGVSLFPPGPGLGGEGVLDDIRQLYARSPRRAWSRYQAELRNTLEWASILDERPWLAPSVEPGIRQLAYGIPLVVDEDRPDQLRACGNAVVALQGAAAFRILAQRLKPC